MAAAIRYARRHEGLTSDNPSVAAFIVRDDGGTPVIVGRGVTAIGGRPHAEVIALEEAGPCAKGATAYVTLEPCAHFGKTPPCANALINAGIARVIIGASDPDNRVSGRGVQMLKDAGIEVVENLLADAATFGLAGFLTRTTQKRPFTTLKMAMTKDGMLGAQTGEQVMITGPVSNSQVHILRAINDAILVGSGTALNDDPSLTCRLNGLEHRSPTRIILDRRLRIPQNSKLAQTAEHVRTIIVHGAGSNALVENNLNKVEYLELNDKGDKAALRELLIALGEKDISTLLVEGGAQVAKSFLDAGLVDRLILFQAPHAFGKNMNGVAAPITPQNMSSEFVLKNQMTFGDDVMYEYECVK